MFATPDDLRDAVRNGHYPSPEGVAISSGVIRKGRAISLTINGTAYDISGGSTSAALPASGMSPPAARANILGSGALPPAVQATSTVPVPTRADVPSSSASPLAVPATSAMPSPPRAPSGVSAPPAPAPHADAQARPHIEQYPGIDIQDPGLDRAYCGLLRQEELLRSQIKSLPKGDPFRHQRKRQLKAVQKQLSELPALHDRAKHLHREHERLSAAEPTDDAAAVRRTEQRARQQALAIW